MDLWQLKIFCKVVELNSFSKAGGVVHLSQPTVSSHIKDLENSLSCRLIDRLPKKAIPTKAGELLYQYARKLLSLREEAHMALSDFQGTIKGRLLIGGSTIPGVYILPRIIGRFIKLYPDVTVSLLQGDTQQVTDAVISGDLELGIVGARCDDPACRQEPIVDDQLCLVVPWDHKWAGFNSVTMEMLRGEPFIVREPGSGTLRSIQERFSRKGYDLAALRIVAEMGSTEAICQAIKAKVGLSILSAVAVNEDVTANRLKTLDIQELALTRRFYLTSNRQRTSSPVAQAFEDLIRTDTKPLIG